MLFFNASSKHRQVYTTEFSSCALSVLTEINKRAFAFGDLETPRVRLPPRLREWMLLSELRSRGAGRGGAGIGSEFGFHMKQEQDLRSSKLK